MSTLSGQTIQSTYQGLLKLGNSTTGITSSFQSIEDGLGNTTGSRIGTNLFAAPNVVGMNINAIAPDAMGPGVSVGAFNPGAGSQNNLLFGYFYDTGVHSYSSITTNVTTQTTTGDNLEVLFYDLQFVKDYGLFPRNQIMSGVTIATSPTGYLTANLPSTLSFSGTGAGFYAIVLKYTNSGATPSVRYGLSLFTTANQSFAQSMGIVRNNAGTAFVVANRGASYTGGQSYWFSNQTTPATITAADVASRFNTTSIVQPFGFNLNVIK